MSTFEVTNDRRVILSGSEIRRVLGFSIVSDAGKDPEVVLRVAVDKINIDGYTNVLSMQRES